MSKMKLDLGDLAVESFHPDDRNAALRGTVQAHATHAPSCPVTCPNTCQATCPVSCVNCSGFDTCANSCDGTCDITACGTSDYCSTGAIVCGGP